jgi:hypothetical protein
MAFEEVYNCEMLIMEIERHPVLYDCSLKEYSDKCLTERLWEEVCKAIALSRANWMVQRSVKKGKQCCF